MRRESSTNFDERRRTAAWWVTSTSAAVLVLTPLWCVVIAFRGHWVPSNDWAVVVARGIDTFSAHPPLIGQWTSLSSYVGHDVNQPGPLQFWLLGVPERLFGGSFLGPLVGQALLATAAAAVFMLAARRRGGMGLLGPATVVLALLFHSLGAVVLRSPYNPSAAVLGLIAYLAAAWSIMCDDDAFWPVLIVAGSLSVQSHVTYLIPMCCIGAVIVVTRVVRWRRGAIPAHTRRHFRTVLGLSAASILVCWCGPVIDQIWGSGNLWRLIRAGTQATHPVGTTFAVHRLVEQLGLVPRWLMAPWINGPVHPSLWTWVTAALVGVALIGALLVSRRPGAEVRFRLGLLTVVSLVGAFIGTARIPNEPLALISPNNRLLWWPTAAFTWLFLMWTLVVLLTPVARRTVGDRRGAIPALPFALAALVAVVVTTGFLSRAAAPRFDSVSITYGEVAEFSSIGVHTCVGRPGPIAVTGDAAANAGSMSGVVAVLRLHGCDVHTTNWQYFGSEHRVTGREPIELRILGTSVAPPGFHLVAQYDPAHPPPRWKDFNRSALFVVSRHSFLYQRGG